MNKVFLLGNLGQDPIMKKTDKITITSFSIATTERYKDKQGEKKTITEWHNVVTFGKLAEIVEKYVKKGDKLLIEGKIKTDEFEKDGIKRYSTKIIGKEMQMLGSKNKTNVNNENETIKQPQGDDNQEDGDLPF